MGTSNLLSVRNMRLRLQLASEIGAVLWCLHRLWGLHQLCIVSFRIELSNTQLVLEN